MNSGLFEALGGKARMPQGNPMQMLSKLRQNPMQFLQRAGMRVPQNMNDPNQIIQYLMNSGQVSQQRYEQARQMAAKLTGR